MDRREAATPVRDRPPVPQLAPEPPVPPVTSAAAALRTRWTRALAAFLVVFLAGGVANLLATRSTSGAFREVAVRMEDEAEALALLRSDIVSTALVRSAAIQGLGVGRPEVEAAEAKEAASYARALRTLRPGAGREVVERQLERSRQLWPDDVTSLTPIQLATRMAQGRTNFELLEEAAEASRRAARADLAAAADRERAVTVATAAAILLLVVLGVRFARRLSSQVLRPVAELRDSANRLAAGELDHRVPVQRADEIGELAASFNAMAEVIARSHRDLSHQASHDGLTGLANRAAFRARLQQALAQPERRDRTQAVLFVDLDDFKDVNDALGHAVGDEVLRAVASRLTEAVRPGDLVARLGGDEFALVLDGIASADAAVDIAERAVAALSAPVEVADTTVRVGASAGLALRHEGSDPEGLMDEADIAMYRAKGQGKNRVLRFRPAAQNAAAPLA